MESGACFLDAFARGSLANFRKGFDTCMFNGFPARVGWLRVLPEHNVVESKALASVWYSTDENLAAIRAYEAAEGPGGVGKDATAANIGSILRARDRQLEPGVSVWPEIQEMGDTAAGTLAPARDCAF